MGSKESVTILIQNMLDNVNGYIKYLEEKVAAGTATDLNVKTLANLKGE